MASVYRFAMRRKQGVERIVLLSITEPADSGSKFTKLLR